MDCFGLRAGHPAARTRLKGQRLVGVRLPHVGHTLWARPGTSDPVTFDAVFGSGEYDLPFRSFSPKTILDLGANVGYTSVLFASRWPGARVLAVEPSPERFAMLQQNVAAWPNVTALRAAARSRSIPVPRGRSGATQAGDAPAPFEARAPSLTLDELIQGLGVERVSLIRMDVEDAGAELFKTSAEWLGRTDALLVELHDGLVPRCAKGLCDGLRGRSFRQEIVGRTLAIDLR